MPNFNRFYSQLNQNPCFKPKYADLHKEIQLPIVLKFLPTSSLESEKKSDGIKLKTLSMFDETTVKISRVN